MQGKHIEEIHELPRPITDDREVLDLRDINNPRVAEVIEGILKAEWAPECADFDHEVD